MTDLITSTGRIKGTRITVFDVLDYAQVGHDASFIAATLSLNSEQVAAALAYIDEHRDAVLADYQRMREQDARGNSPEIVRKTKASRAKVQSLVNGHSGRMRAEKSGARHPGRH